MSEVPPEEPSPPPVVEPPVQYAHYYRPQTGPSFHGSAEKLQALADGYFGLNWVFLANIALSMGFGLVVGALARGKPVDPFDAVHLLVYPVVGLAVGLLSYPQNKKIGYGVGWSPSGPAIASTLMGLNSALCCGIIGFVVMQQIAASEMKKYGVRVGVVFTRRQVQAVIDNLRPTQPQKESSAP